MGLFEKYKKV
jgi:hypothetical protein